ncbi:EAL domain-containing protein [Nisaea sp.]|uniref:EAL domain-containing protein n=2 Tax=Alphaproteobacteria TaxID=28211 RepID=UPI0032632EF9
MLRTHLRLYLFAIRDAFITLLPLTFCKVMAELAQELPLPAYQEMMNGVFGNGWKLVVGQMIDASVAAWTVGTAVAIAVYTHQRLSRQAADRGPMPSFMISFSALVNFMLYVFMSGTSLADGFSSGAMSAAILIGLASAIVPDVLSRWHVPWPWQFAYDTDVVFSRALQACIPTAVAALFTILLCAVLLLPALSAIPQQVFEWAFGTDSRWSILAATFVNQVTWFFGAHGGSVLRTASDTLLAGSSEPHLFSLEFQQLFVAFVLMGGSGSTLGLLLAIFLTVREGSQLRVARLGVVPSLFNINEVVLFGLPVVLNPIYLAPFVGVPVLLALITIGALESGFISLGETSAPWTTPPLISGWMATESWRGAALQSFLIALSTALYFPFVQLAERRRGDYQADLVAKAADAIMEEKKRSPVIRRQDDVGLVARAMLVDLRQAIARGELELHYQPKLDKHETVVGLEALLRWNHRRHGPLAPILAVTLAEDGGLINELGGWVIGEACACKARLNALGYTGLKMALNVSPMQLEDPALPEQVARALERGGLAPDEVELEITESQAIPDSEQADSAFRRLSEIGVHLSMDDFGMGYSSLLYLRRFNVGAIKIDGSLSRDVLTHKANADIIRSIAALGETRGVSIVAEFVETEPQRDMLIALGCTQFQGYLFSRPLPEAACIEFLQACRVIDSPGTTGPHQG